MAQLNISLPPGLKRWVESRVDDGRYSSPSEYIRELLRRDEADTATFAQLQAAIDEGRASGEGRNYKDVFDEIRSRSQAAE